MKQHVKAVCVVEIQVECDSRWTDETTMAQIVKQAEADASGRIRTIFHDAATPDADMTVKRHGLAGLSFLGIRKITAQVVTDRE